MTSNSATVVVCPSCNARHELPADYVAQYAGMEFDCTCGQSLGVPSAQPYPAAAIQRQSAAAVASLAYAAPSFPPEPVAKGVWRDGQYVVIARGTRMPSRCCVCNAALEQEPGPKTMKWVPPEHRGGRGMLWLIRKIIGDSYSQSIVVRIGRCPAHRYEFGLRGIGWTLFAAGLVAIPVSSAIAKGATQVNASIVVIGALLLAGVVVASFHRSIEIEYFKGNYAWMKNFGDAYLQSLPSLQEEYSTETGRISDRLKGH